MAHVVVLGAGTGGTGSRSVMTYPSGMTTW
jgi:hypothetical protein